MLDTKAQYSLSIETSRGQRNRMETPGTDSRMHQSVTGKELEIIGETMGQELRRLAGQLVTLLSMLYVTFRNPV